MKWVICLNTIGLFLSLLGIPGYSSAQIIPDNTLPVTSDVTPGCTRCIINGGTERGVNLYHSFQEFSIPTNGSAWFNNAPQIQNILTRVTGSSISNIDGLIQTNGTANLFFLNPNGIVFGANARLQIGGSFFATTASSFQFSDGSEFSTINPQHPPLLTLNITPGLQTGVSHPSVTLSSRGNLSAAQNLTLNADQLDLQGRVQAGQNLTLQATNTVKIRDDVATPFVAQAGEQLLIRGNQGVDIFTLNHPNSRLMSGKDMVLQSPGSVIGDAHYYSGGSFRIEQLDGTLGSLSSPNDPVIRSLGDVSFSNYFGASLHIFAGGSVNIPGVIAIGAPDAVNGVVENVVLSNGNVVSISGNTQPTLDIRAGLNPTQVGVPLGLTGANDSFFDPTFSNIEPPIISSSATSADISIGRVLMFGQESSNGIVLLTNNYNPNLTLTGGDIQVGIINTDDVSGSFSGNSSSVILDSRSDVTITGYVNASSTSGNAGDLLFLAKGAIALSDGVLIAADTSGSGEGGEIYLQAGSVSLSNRAGISVKTFSTGDGGNLTIKALDRVDLIGLVTTGQQTTLATQTTGTGSGGELRIETQRLNVRDGATVQSLTSSSGKGGDLHIKASEVYIGRNSSNEEVSSVSTETSGTATGGSIKIEVGKLIIEDGGWITNFSNGDGSGGSLTITALDSVQLTGGDFPLTGISALTFGNATTGDSTIRTQRLVVQNDARINVITIGEGQGGNLNIEASESIWVAGGKIFADTRGEERNAGDAGDLKITTQRLTVQPGQTSNGAITSGQISAGTMGTGKGGNLNINATELIELVGGSDKLDGLTVQTSGAGDAGNLTANVDLLIIRDGARLAADTTGTGNGGNLEITAKEVIVQNAQVSASTFGRGSAGNLSVFASESVDLIGTFEGQGLSPSGLFAQANRGSRGQSGDLTVITKYFRAKEGGQVSVSSRSGRDAGTLLINASERVELIGTSQNIGLPSGLFGETAGSGNGGDLIVTTKHLSIWDGAEIGADTIGRGKGGSIIVNASESIEINGTAIDGKTPSRLTVRTESAGDAGDIRITTKDLNIGNQGQISASTSDLGRSGSIFVEATGSITIKDRAAILVDSQGVGEGGNIQILGGKVTLDNQAILSAETSSSQGGNITLDLNDILLLRRGSTISTTAGTAQSGGDGGNITINAPFIIGVLSENSDITANAFNGRGGNITITTNGIYGLRFQPKQTPLSDITASSQFGISGTVTLNTLNVDPNRGLVALPIDLVDPAQQISQTCTPQGVARASSFTVTGRGGLPPSPDEPLQNQGDLADWVVVEDQSSHTTEQIDATQTGTLGESSIVEAQGWQVDRTGTVALIAKSFVPKSQMSWQPLPTCR